MPNPLISVIIPFGGDGDVIKTLASIKNQKSVDIEIIVVTRKFSSQNSSLHEFRDVRVVQESRPGVYGALNTGLVLASGQFCCFLSGGALFNSHNVLKNYLSILQKNPKAVFVNAGWIQLRNGAEPSTFRAKKIQRRSHFWSAQPVNIEAICFIRDEFRNIRFDEKYAIAADFKFIRNLLSEGESVFMGYEVVTLPPPGLSSDINHNGEQEVSDIRIEFLQGYFGRFSSFINSFTISLLKFPGFVKVWVRIIIKKVLKNYL